MGWTQWHGDKIKKLTSKQTSEALIETAEATLGESQKQVPLDEGTLQETGMVKVNPRNSHEVVISYGGGFGTPFTKVPYALKWHEVPADFQHGRKHNYLLDPINNFAPKALRKILAKKLKQAWR